MTISLKPAVIVVAILIGALALAALLVGRVSGGTLDTWSHIYVLVYQPVRVPLYVGLTEQNAGYLAAKRDRIGHMIPTDSNE